MRDQRGPEPARVAINESKHCHHTTPVNLEQRRLQANLEAL
jgi:hypothetical protein